MSCWTVQGEFLGLVSLMFLLMVKKGIVHCLEHRAKTISCDTDAYQEEMISLRHNLHCNSYPERITLTSRNLDRRIEDNTHHSMSALCQRTSRKDPKDM